MTEVSRRLGAALPSAPRRLLWVFGLVCAAGCATTTSQSERRKEALAAKIWDEKSPYGFHRAVAKTMLRTQQPKRAIPHIQRLLSIEPDKPEPHLIMGQAHLALGLRAEAREELRRAIAFDESYSPAHALLGVLLDQQGESKKAEAHHRRSVKISPRVSAFHNNLGFNLYLQGRDKEAVKSFRAALALDPAKRRIHNNLGFAYARLGQLDKAYKHFRLGGSDAETNNNMGFAHERRGELERAYRYYLRAAKQAPKIELIRQNLARVCQRLGKPVPQLLPSPERKADTGGKGS